jgi:hypothetical protein
VWLVGVTEATLVAELRERAGAVTTGRGAKDRDVVFVQIDSEAQLDRVDRAAAAIRPDGAVWAVHPKGKQGVADTAIYARAKMLGLTSTKVARVSDTLTAEKLVWPRASRGT